MVRENQIKKALREGRIAVGTAVGEFGVRSIAKLLEYADIDYVMLDMEHSAWCIDHVADLIAWFKATRITVLVRPPDTLYHFIAGIMDAGASGIQGAHVDTAEQAQAMVDAVMYPPLGKRGVGFNAAHTDFQKPKAAEYMAQANAEASIVATIESKLGLENIDRIAAVDGIDIIQASYSDLSVDLGVPQQYAHPTFKAALHKVADACRRHGKGFKFNPHNDESLAEAYALGCRVLQVRSTTVAFQDAVRGDVEHLRSAVRNLGGAA
jgi:2-keto-3-deoxy-L-rhamnonate aldolase RhmA